MGLSTTTDLGHFDVLIIGGGFSGIWQLHTLRNLGFKVKLLEAGTGLGGIWHWNAYPGARVDTAVPTYQLTSPETLSFDWKETFPSRDELVEYFRHLDNVWDLSKDVECSARLMAMRWDEGEARWRCSVNDGEMECSAWAVVLCTGFAAKRYLPPFREIERYEGEIHHTAAWPQEGVELKGRRVAVIGTGASGVQVIQEVAKEASHLTVFQRTPNTALPMTNPNVDNDTWRQDFPDTAEKMRKTFAGFDFDFAKPEKPPLEMTREERFELYEQLYYAGGLEFWLGAYFEMLFDEELNEEAYQFWRSKTVPRILDPAKAEILAPANKIHPFGTKRISLEHDFFEIFNQDNVDLVDLRSNAIEGFTPTGIKTSDGHHWEVDLVVLATGFDSHTGGLTQIDIRNARGMSLEEKWSNGTYTNLGMTTAGFKNMFFIYGPQAPTAFGTGPQSAETQGGWIVAALQHMRDKGFRSMEATPESEQQYRQHVNDIANQSLFPQADSWYFGANIPGKEREALNYMAGFPEYRRTIWGSADSGYSGFVFEH